jgi:hypothetical protein
MPLLVGAIDASVDPDDAVDGTAGAANEIPRSAIDHRAFSQIRRG